MYNFDGIESDSNFYWKTDDTSKSQDFLGDREKNLLRKYLRRSSRCKISTNDRLIIPNPENEEVQENDEVKCSQRSTTIRKPNNYVIILFIITILLSFLRPAKSIPLGMNPLMASMLGYPRPMSVPQQMVGQQYPMQSPYYRQNTINQIPAALPFYNQNQMAGLNSGGFNSLDTLMNSQNTMGSNMDATVLDRLLKIVASDLKKSTVDTQTVKNNAISLFHTLGISENRINLLKLDSAQPGFVLGYNEAIVDISREMGSRYPAIPYQPLTAMTQYGQFTQPLSGTSYNNPSAMNEVQLLGQLSPMVYPYNLLSGNLLQTHPSSSTKEKTDKKSKEKDKHSKKKSHRRSHHHDDEDESEDEGGDEYDDDSYSHRKRSHREHRRHHKYT